MFSLNMQSNSDQYDAFISHAVEDKLPIANELCARLEQAGLNIWYSGRELRVGDMVTDTILEGLEKSRFGIVIFSPTYVSKFWTLREFYVLLTKTKEEHKVILPILYDITPEDLAKKDLTMADIFALRADKGIDYIVDHLVSEISSQKQKEIRLAKDKIKEKRHRRIKRSSFILILLTILFTALYGFKKFTYTGPSQITVQQNIDKRVNAIEEKVSKQINNVYELKGAVKSNRKEITKICSAFSELDAYYRNEYFLDYGETVQSKKNINRVLDLDVESLTETLIANLEHASIFLAEKSPGSINREFAIINKKPVEFRMGSIYELPNNIYAVDVKFYDNVRMVNTQLTFTPSSNGNKGMKRKEIQIIALLPTERFLFEEKNGEWICSTTKIP